MSLAGMLFSEVVLCDTNEGSGLDTLIQTRTILTFLLIFKVVTGGSSISAKKLMNNEKGKNFMSFKLKKYVHGMGVKESRRWFAI